MSDDTENDRLKKRAERLRELRASFSAKAKKPISDITMPHVPPPGVLSPGAVPMATDSATYGWMDTGIFLEDGGDHFLGYPKLAELAQRPEYRVVSESIADEMVRKWIRFEAKNEKKVQLLAKEFRRLKVREVFKRAALHDGLYGMGHIFIQLGGALDTQLPADELRTGIGGYAAEFKVPKGSLRALRNIEPMWTYPGYYTTSDPLSESWYSPQSWHIMGREIHASRLLTFVGREVADMLKPAYNFGGISLSQMVKPYVDNWLRIREDVGDTVEAFSTSVLKTDMFRAIDGAGADAGLVSRVELFTQTRSTKGVLLVDKETEDFDEAAKPLSTLDALQAQAQEHMASVTRIPLIKLLGIQPSGLNASSEGEIRVWEDNILAYQEAMFRPALEKLLPIVQMSLFGEIDPGIEFSFVPLHEMTEKEKMEICKMRADVHSIYIQAGVFGTDEVREIEINEDGSFYAGLDPDDLPDPSGEEGAEGDPVLDALGQMAETGGEDDPTIAGLGGMADLIGTDEFKEADHDRDEGGKFTSTGGNGQSSQKTVQSKTAKHEKTTINSEGKRVTASGKPLPKHIASLTIPPAWTEVTYHPSPDADLLVTGLDQKGRRQSIYSDAHWAKSAAVKFDRIKKLDEQFHEIQSQNEKARRSQDAKTRIAADCLALVMSTGIRPGSEDDTGAEKKAYGATTLLGKHVVKDESGVYLQFVGKKGVSLNIPVLDKEMQKMVLDRKKNAGDEGQLFGIDEKTLLSHVHSLGDGSYKTKDFRTRLGTRTALDLVNARPAPKNEKEYKKAVKDVAVAVSKKLGNTPTVALQSYISPFVFDGWKGALA